MRKGLKQAAAGALCVAFGFAAGATFDYRGFSRAAKKKDAEIKRCNG